MLGRRSLVTALAMLPLCAAATAAQEECRGWSTTCAAVEVRTDASGERLILFAPNIPATSVAATEETPGSDRLTVLPAAGGEMVIPPTSGEDPDDTSCDDSRDRPAAAGDLEKDDEEDDCDDPVGAFFLLALPPALYALGPGGDEPVVHGPDGGFPSSPPTSTPGNDGSDNDGGSGNGAGQGGSNDGGAYDTPGDGGSDDGTVGDDGSGADDGSDDGSSGGNASSTPGGSDNGGTGGGTGGDTGSGGSGGSPGVGDPYHPGVQDLPPISQVPEPVSTTLFGLGLAGYAGAALRRRRGRREEEATDRV